MVRPVITLGPFITLVARHVAFCHRAEAYQPILTAAHQFGFLAGLPEFAAASGLLAKGLPASLPSFRYPCLAFPDGRDALRRRLPLSATILAAHG